MFSQICSCLKHSAMKHCCRAYSSSPSIMKITICGAAGRIGQPLALLLKQCDLLDEIALYDICPTCGFGMELGHVDTKCKITSYTGKQSIAEALSHAKVVVTVAAAVSGDSFDANAPIVSEIALAASCNCPKASRNATTDYVHTQAQEIAMSANGAEIYIALLCLEPVAVHIVATEPVEAMIPLAAEVLRLRGVYDYKKVIGLVDCSSIRASTLLAEFLAVPPEGVHVPVVGGTSRHTMVPVLSHAAYPTELTQEQTDHILGCLLCEERAAESTWLTGACGTARGVLAVVRGLCGQPGVRNEAFVASGVVPDCDFFANEVAFGTSGIEKNMGVPELTRLESCLLAAAVPRLREVIRHSRRVVRDVCQVASQPLGLPGGPPTSTCAALRLWTAQAESDRKDAACTYCVPKLKWHTQGQSHSDPCAPGPHRVEVRGRQCGCDATPCSVHLARDGIDKKARGPCK